MIPSILLVVTFVFAFFRPRGAAYMAAAICAFWFEWRLPVGVRLGLFEVLFCGGLCGLWAGNGGVRFRWDVPFGKLVTAFIIVSAISAAWTHDESLAKNVWIVFKPTIFSASFFLFYLTLDDRIAVDKALRLFLISATVCALIGFAQRITYRPLGIFFTGTYLEDVASYFDRNEQGGILRIFSSLQHSTVLGAFMIIPVSILGAIKLVNLQRNGWIFCGSAMIIQAIALVASLSRSAWAGLGIAMMIVFWTLGILKRRWFWIVGILAVLLFAGAVQLRVLPSSLVMRIESLRNAKNDNAMIPRYQRWEYFFDRSMEHPWLGHGIVADQAAVQDLEYAVSPHNAFLLIAVQRGWVAAAIMTGILLAMLRMGWRSAKRATGHWKGIRIGLFAGAVGTYVVAGIFTALWEDLQSSVVFWLILALTARTSEFAFKREKTITEGGMGDGKMERA